MDKDKIQHQGFENGIPFVGSHVPGYVSANG
jgi:hypothetical protein